MPVYDYKCLIHGVFEVQQSIKDAPLEECSKCAQDGITEYYCKFCDSSWMPSENEQFKLNVKCINCSGVDNIIIRVPKPKKLISLSSFILKGGGWASEGYK
jgi:putative FmdB family regulatory protein